MHGTTRNNKKENMSSSRDKAQRKPSKKTQKGKRKKNYRKETKDRLTPDRGKKKSTRSIPNKKGQKMD